MAEIRFRSKVDIGLATVLIGTPAAVVALLESQRAVVPVWGAVLVALLGVVLPLWLLQTDYTVTDQQLRIRSGPFRWHVPLAEIRSWRRTRSLLSSPALSIDRLLIDYGTMRSVMISPKDTDAFVQALTRRR